MFYSILLQCQSNQYQGQVRCKYSSTNMLPISRQTRASPMCTGLSWNHLCSMDKSSINIYACFNFFTVKFNFFFFVWKLNCQWGSFFLLLPFLPSGHRTQDTLILTVSHFGIVAMMNRISVFDLFLLIINYI